MKTYILKATLLGLLILVFNGAEAQRITTKSDVQDLGQVLYETPVTARFTLRNKGGDMTITAVRPSCGCTGVDYPKTLILRGDSFQITATYDARQLGHFEKEVAVYGSTFDKPFYLKMRGVVVADGSGVNVDWKYKVGSLLCEKNDVEFDDVNRGDEPLQRVRFKNTSDKAVEPVVMHLPSYLKAEVSPRRVSPGRTGEITLRLFSQKLRRFGLTQASVYVGMFPGDKVSQDKELTLSAVLLPDFDNLSETQRMRAPKLSLSKEEVNFGSWDGKDLKSETITLANLGQSTLEIRSLQMFTTGMKVKLNKTKLSGGETAKMRITVNRKLLRLARSKPRVLMITNDPDNSKVVIRVNVAEQ